MSAAEALPQEDTTVRGRVNPQSQLAEWEAMKAAQRHVEDDDTSDDTSDDEAMPIEYILDTEYYCDEFRREQGEPVHEHAPMDDYTLDELVAMHDYAVCPLHLSPRYPHVPEGVWKRDYHMASVKLHRITHEHAEAAPDGIRFFCASDGCDDTRTCDDNDEPTLLASYLATPAELREVWDEFPHARWAFEADADAGYVTIEIVEE